MKAFFGLIGIVIILFLMNGGSCSSKPAAPAQKTLYEQDGVLQPHRKLYYEMIKRGVPPETAARDVPELYVRCQEFGFGAECRY